MQGNSVVFRRAAALLIGISTMLMMAPAYAQFTRVNTVLQNIINAVTGSTGRLVAIIAVCVVGLAWMFGLLDLRRAGVVIVGIAVLFGAAEIVSTIVGA